MQRNYKLILINQNDKILISQITKLRINEISLKLNRMEQLIINRFWDKNLNSLDNPIKQFIFNYKYTVLIYSYYIHIHIYS